MRLLELFTSHLHYWGVPHRPFRDNRLVQTCYQCSAQRVVRVSFPDSNDTRLAITENEIAT
jgi:hypothetical protein